MLSTRSPYVTICSYCQKVYDPQQEKWMDLRDYSGLYGDPPDGYLFSETFCADCFVIRLAAAKAQDKPVQAEKSRSNMKTSPLLSLE